MKSYFKYKLGEEEEVLTEEAKNKALRKFEEEFYLQQDRAEEITNMMA